MKKRDPRDIELGAAFWSEIATLFAILCCAFMVIFLLARPAKAQPAPTIGEMLAPYEIRCGKVKEQLEKLKRAPKYRSAIEVTPSALSKWISHHVFGYAPPVEHFILFTTTDGGTILIPCEFGDVWAGKSSNRVELDMKWKRGLSVPVTELPEPVLEEPKAKGRKK